MNRVRTFHGITRASGGFRAGQYRPDRPGNAVVEDGGKAPPIAPVNSSTGGQETSPTPYYTRLREATAENIARHDASIRLRRFSWEPEDRSPSSLEARR